jgi:hypothetical protein
MWWPLFFPPLFVAVAVDLGLRVACACLCLGVFVFLFFLLSFIVCACGVVFFVASLTGSLVFSLIWLALLFLFSSSSSSPYCSFFGFSVVYLVVRLRLYAVPCCVIRVMRLFG